jgi:hypothetical protein
MGHAKAQRWWDSLSSKDKEKYYEKAFKSSYYGQDLTNHEIEQVYKNR